MQCSPRRACPEISPSCERIIMAYQKHTFDNIDKFIAYLDQQGLDGEPPVAASMGEAYSVGHRDGHANACRVLADIVRNSNLTVAATASPPIPEGWLLVPVERINEIVGALRGIVNVYGDHDWEIIAQPLLQRAFSALHQYDKAMLAASSPAVGDWKPDYTNQGPIKVSCKCGWQEMAPDELIGNIQTPDLSCPRCGEVFKTWPTHPVQDRET